MRIELGGQGSPIPPEALPDGIGADGLLPPITLTFNSADEFDKNVWTSFGYEIFTVMVVGAAGGRGSFAWYILGGGWYAPPMIFTYGGGGGGGGMHIVSGLLADLDDISEIIVGEAGAHADDAWPGYSAYPVSYNHYGIDVGDPGEDGGYSSFGDVAMASGGKGGEVSPVVISADPATSWRPGGDGGEGGVGNSIVAGGGAAGGTSTDLGPGGDPGWPGPPRHHIWSSTDGEQGFLDLATGIGEGGGGGVGFTGGGFGVGQDAAWITDTDTAGFQILSVHDTDETDGGRGNFNYSDSSKHGARQNKPSRVISSHISPTNFNPYAVWTYTQTLPGGGGGARPTPLAKYGSYADGYSPNGVVIVRVA